MAFYGYSLWLFFSDGDMDWLSSFCYIAVNIIQKISVLLLQSLKYVDMFKKAFAGRCSFPPTCWVDVSKLQPESHPTLNKRENTRYSETSTPFFDNSWRKTAKNMLAFCWN